MSTPRIFTRKADADERDSIIRAMNACARRYQDFNDFWFDDELVSSEGCHVELYVPEGTTKDAINEAFREARGARDVVAFTVVECPNEWFAEVTPPKPRTIREMLWEGERPSRLIKQIARIEDEQARADAIDMVFEAYQDRSEQRAYMAYEMAARGVVPDACMGHVRNLVMQSESTAYWNGPELWNEHIEPGLTTYAIVDNGTPVGQPFYSLAEANTARDQLAEKGAEGLSIEENGPSVHDPLARNAAPESNTLQP
jgi:hypothetical protein